MNSDTLQTPYFYIRETGLDTDAAILKEALSKNLGVRTISWAIP